MTVSGGTKAHDRRAGAARGAAFLENIRRGLGAVLRRPRPPPYPPPQAGEGREGANFVPVWRRLKIHGALTVCVVALSMLYLDAPALEFAAGLPPWLVDG